MSNGVSPAHHPWVFPSVIALFSSLTFLPLPRQPYLLDDSLSEKMVLSYAAQHHFQYGSDIVFTYGPWGYLVARHFLPYHHHTQIFVLGIVSFLVALGVCLFAWRLNLIWRVLMIALFVYLSSNIDPRADLLIYTGILCWGWLCLQSERSHFVFYAATLVFMLIFSVMVKANFLLLAAFTILVVGFNLIARGRIWPFFFFILGAVGLFTCAWIGSGQSLWKLPDFFSKSFWIIKDYDQVVGLDAPPVFTIAGILLCSSSIAAIGLRVLGSKKAQDGQTLCTLLLSRTAITLWLIFFVFVLWKHAFVRADLYHMGFLFGLAPVLALSLEILPSSGKLRTITSRALAVITCLVSVITLQWLFVSSARSSLIQPFFAWGENLSSLLHPHLYQSSAKALLQTARGAAQLPVLKQSIDHESVDVFGQEQCYALLNDFTYRPRPVFQSYLAFNENLMNLNEKFYRSPEAPHFVLFRLNAGDRIFPPLQDAKLLRYLLLNFEFVKHEKPFLLLHAKSSSVPQQKLLSEGMAQFEEHINLSQGSNHILWTEISLEPSAAGRLLRTFYKPVRPRIAFWNEDGKKAITRSGAPASMLAAGFVASPLLFKTEHVHDFYNHTNLIRPAYCSLEIATEAKKLWKVPFSYKVYAVQTESSSAVKQQPKLDNDLAARLSRSASSQSLSGARD